MAQNRNFKHLVHIWVTEGQKEKMYNLKTHTGMSPGKLFREWLDYGLPKHSTKFEIEIKNSLKVFEYELGKQGGNINQLAHQANSYMSMPNLPQQLDENRNELRRIANAIEEFNKIIKENL